LSSLDEQQHGHGPFSPEANRDLELIDGQLAQLFAAARANDPQAIAVVVSDHGFVRITHKVNLMQPFLRAGLIQAGGDWKAQPWSGAGMAAVMLRDPADSQTRSQVRDLLRSLQADPNNGIAEVLEREAMAKRGAFPDASFLVIMKLGYYALADATSPLVSEIQGTLGSHGFSPDYPQMRAAFFISGPGIAHHRDLGLIDMRQIAPTLAQLLNVRLPAALQPRLTLQ
jgi:predicted AlkP superfamily pyrophosphatase or phosphodiesterase